MSFRFDEDLINLVKEKAKAQRRSLSNYIEMLMAKDIGNVPNEDTIKAIEEARKGELDTIEDINEWLENI